VSSNAFSLIAGVHNASCCHISTMILAFPVSSARHAIAVLDARDVCSVPSMGAWKQGLSGGLSRRSPFENRGGPRRRTDPSPAPGI
jgi:hypothetical protein